VCKERRKPETIMMEPGPVERTKGSEEGTISAEEKEKKGTKKKFWNGTKGSALTPKRGQRGKA